MNFRKLLCELCPKAKSYHTKIRVLEILNFICIVPGFLCIQERVQRSKDEVPKGLMKEVLETYKPHILTRRRRLIEDCVRDLRLNNDHIHIIEQEMRKAVRVSGYPSMTSRASHEIYNWFFVRSGDFLGLIFGNLIFGELKFSGLNFRTSFIFLIYC